MFVTVATWKCAHPVANGQSPPDSCRNGPAATPDIQWLRTVYHRCDDLATAAEPACGLNRDGDLFLDVTIGFPVRLCKRVPGQHGAVDMNNHLVAVMGG